ncbi:hypothetical protein [Actinoplanes sp. TFC3]|uniref:hypothetical protein n=1 Tax=Actinoplanes sp. TFC3 TaxID=1710355 RepID=UPI000830339D|nr:hypothetical protein [Actinoplanes sp. TFC3]
MTDFSRDELRRHPRPPAHLVAAAEQDYHWASAQTDDFTVKVRVLLDAGWTPFEAVVEVYRTLSSQPSTGATMVSAVALVRLAQTPPTASSAAAPLT